MWHMYKLWSEGAFYSLYSTKLFSRDIVPTLMFFRRFIFNCDFGRPLPLWRNVTQIEAGNFWAILYLSTVEQQQSPLGLVDRYVDLANPCFAILGEQNLELCSWCCVASISPAALWHHPQRSCEGENKNISLEGLNNRNGSTGICKQFHKFDHCSITREYLRRHSPCQASLSTLSTGAKVPALVPTFYNLSS